MGRTRPVTDPRAGELLDRYRALFGGPGLPVPVESIAEDLLGLRIAESDTLAVSGLLLPDQREIWLNAEETRQSAGRRRFTIAHELGHWICQVLEGHTAPIYCRAVEPADGANPPEEREANVFAAELLMPEALVRNECRKGESVERLSVRFGVSQEALRWRLFNLDLAPDPRLAPSVVAK